MHSCKIKGEDALQLPTRAERARMKPRGVLKAGAGTAGAETRSWPLSKTLSEQIGRVGWLRVRGRIFAVDKSSQQLSGRLC